MMTLTALTGHKQKILTVLGTGVALVVLTACAGQAPAASGNQNNSNVVPAGNNAAMYTGERSAQGMAGGYSYYDGRMTGISVAGMGRATAAPDMATINLGVEATRDTVQAARNDAAAAMNEVIEVLRQQGIADEDIQTSHFGINTRYDRNGQTITGFQVSNQLTVKVRDLDNVGPVIDEVVAAGGDLVRFQGISFSIADTKLLEQQARAAAVADLQAKAEELAELTDVPLGQLVSITEVGGAQPLDVPAMERAFAMDSAMPTPIMAGEMDVTITLQALYAIGSPQAEE
jgi:uncharacterized protein